MLVPLLKKKVIITHNRFTMDFQILHGVQVCISRLKDATSNLLKVAWSQKRNHFLYLEGDFPVIRSLHEIFEKQTS